MNCPSCGKQTLPDQKFCRSCGTSTRLITQPLPENDTVSNQETMPRILSKPERQSGSSLLPWAFIIMFIGVAIGITGKMIMHDEIVTAVGALISIAGMFLTAYPYLMPAGRHRHDSSAVSQPELPIQSPPAKSLAPATNVGYVDSITERTTDLLKTPTVSSRQ